MLQQVFVGRASSRKIAAARITIGQGSLGEGVLGVGLHPGVGQLQCWFAAVLVAQGSEQAQQRVGGWLQLVRALVGVQRRRSLAARHGDVAKQAVADGSLGAFGHNVSRALFRLGRFTLAQLDFRHQCHGGQEIGLGGERLLQAVGGAAHVASGQLQQSQSAAVAPGCSRPRASHWSRCSLHRGRRHWPTVPWRRPAAFAGRRALCPRLA